MIFAKNCCKLFKKMCSILETIIYLNWQKFAAMKMLKSAAIHHSDNVVCYTFSVFIHHHVLKLPFDSQHDQYLLSCSALNPQLSLRWVNQKELNSFSQREC